MSTETLVVILLLLILALHFTAGLRIGNQLVRDARLGLFPVYNDLNESDKKDWEILMRIGSAVMGPFAETDANEFRRQQENQ
jgi:hypothetical protein